MKAIRSNAIVMEALGFVWGHMRFGRLAGLVVVIILVMLGMSGCAPDPRNQADADATRLQAEQNSLDQAQARAQNQATYTLQQSEKEQISAQWVTSTNEFIAWWMRAALVAAIVVTISLAASVSISTVGTGLAAAQAAQFRATWIPLDEKTGHYPAISYAGRGRFLITDINTGLTIEANTTNQADRQMVAAAMGVRLAGVVTRNVSRMETDPAGTALAGVNPVQVFDEGRSGAASLQEINDAN